MQISIVQGHTPPPNPNGITVVIDVIRAFTTAHHAFRKGVSRIWLVAEAEDAFALREQHQPDAWLAGEIHALPIEGFDFGNSPWEIDQANLQGKPLILRTTNGVKATLHAEGSEQVLVAGLVNARATASYIAQRAPSHVQLVASHPTGDEDIACAEHIRYLLTGEGITLEEAQERTLNAHAAQKFLNGTHSRLKPQDIHAAARSEGEEGLVMRTHFSPRPYIEPIDSIDPIANSA